MVCDGSVKPMGEVTVAVPSHPDIVEIVIQIERQFATPVFCHRYLSSGDLMRTVAIMLNANSAIAATVSAPPAATSQSARAIQPATISGKPAFASQNCQVAMRSERSG